MLWEIKTEKGWTGWTLHTESGASKEQALQTPITEWTPIGDGNVIDVRWTCQEQHSYFVRGFAPVFKNKAGEVIDTTIWKIKEGKAQAERAGEEYTGAEYTGRTFEIECWLCGDKYFTDTDLDPKRPLHPLCIRGEHIWDIPCQACHPGEIHCGRRPYCGTNKTAKDFPDDKNFQRTDK